METIKNYWEKFVKFLVDYDAKKLVESVRQLDWQEQLWNPYIWLIGLPLLIYLSWKRKFNIIILACSFVLFTFLAQNTLPAPGGAIPLEKILIFLGGSVALLAVNIYFLILRTK
jgi:hypothetical protein